MPHLAPSCIGAALVAALILPSLALPVAAQHSPPIEQPTGVSAQFFHGQTFVSWTEVASTSGERYRVYRHDQPISTSTLSSAQQIFEVWEGSSRYWADYYHVGGGSFGPRFSETMPLPAGTANHGIPAALDRGMLVWTLRPEDFGADPPRYFYAVTSVSPDGVENRAILTSENTCPPVIEAVEEPQPLKIAQFDETDGLVRHVYVQYMDLRDFNPTLTAPNRVRTTYGQDLSDPAIANSVQYAFSYVVLEPPAAPTDVLPVVVKLHPYSSETLYSAAGFTEVSTAITAENYYDPGAVEIRPIDSGSTWWFGFPELGFDYRLFANECDAIDAITRGEPPAVIVNYTEQRVLRMVRDLLRDEHDFQGRLDGERVYVRGYSMGASGALALAMRYPQVFAASYATLPATDFRRLVDPDETCGDPLLGWPADPDCYLGIQLDLAFDVAAKWGAPGLGPNPFEHIYPGTCSFENPSGSEQPIRIDGPAGTADHLKVHEGTSVYDWQDLAASLAAWDADDVAPVSVRHSTSDRIVNWRYQGQPLYEALNAAGVPWGGLVDDFLNHKPWWYLGMPASYAAIPGQGPFFGFEAIRSETVPGLRLLPTNHSPWTLPPLDRGLSVFNVETALSPAFSSSMEWSSSWDPWDGLPIDEPDAWGITLRVTSGPLQLVDVIPHRTQAFQIDVGATYFWSTTTLAGVQVDCGCTVVGADGRLVIPNVHVTRKGVRVHVVPGLDPSCKGCPPVQLGPSVTTTATTQSPVAGR